MANMEPLIMVKMVHFYSAVDKRRTDNKVEATYRKKDDKLTIYRKEFAQWKNKYANKNQELIMQIME